VLDGKVFDSAVVIGQTRPTATMTSMHSDGPRPTKPVDVAVALATALDADDFDSLLAMFDDEVVYRIADDEHHGPEAVVASYCAGSTLARRIFEQVEYSHEIIGLVADRTIRIDFADKLHANGEQLDHHSIQDIEVGEDGRIVSVTDRPVEGQQERVDAFMDRHGLTRHD